MFKYSPPFSKQWARVHILLITFWPKYLLASLAALALPSIVLLASVVLGTVPQHIRLFADWLDYGLSLMTKTACSVLINQTSVYANCHYFNWVYLTIEDFDSKETFHALFIEIMAAFQMKWNKIKCGFTFCHPSMTWKIKHTSTKVVNCSNVRKHRCQFFELFPRPHQIWYPPILQIIHLKFIPQVFAWTCFNNIYVAQQ